MMKESNKLENYSKGYLAIPFEGDEFNNFIIGLLGKPQQITKIIRGNFDIHLKDVQNFHDLVEQRVNQQNEGKLIQFKAKIYYSDDSSVTLGSYSELLTYNEVKPIISEAILLTWIYLIKFNNKDVPEKQEINLLIGGTPIGTKENDDEISFFQNTTPGGFFKIDINHTARTWGTDMEALLSNQVNSIMRSPTFIKRFFIKFRSLIGTFSGLLFFFGGLIGLHKSIVNLNNNLLSGFDKIKVDSPNSVYAQIEFLIQFLQNREIENSINGILGLVIMVVSFILGGVIYNLSDNRTPSFVVLTREALKNKERQLKTVNRKWKALIFTVIIGIMINIISSYIFSYLISK